MDAIDDLAFPFSSSQFHNFTGTFCRCRLASEAAETLGFSQSDVAKNGRKWLILAHLSSFETLTGTSDTCSLKGLRD
jgi:hypothetical protein